MKFNYCGTCKKCHKTIDWPEFYNKKKPSGINEDCICESCYKEGK